MRAKTALVATMSIVCAGAACTEPTAPAPPALPDPDTSLDPDRLVLGDVIATPCGPHAELRERKAWRVVDVFFHTGGDSATDGPLAEHVEAVEAHGGVVLYRFNVPAVRTWIRLDRAPALIRATDWTTVHEVPDLRRYDYRVAVGLDPALIDSVAARFRELGGRVRHRFEDFGALYGAIPDRSVPDLRAADGVDRIGAEGIACVGGGRRDGV